VIGCAGFDALLCESGANGFDVAKGPEFARHLAACPACMATFVGYTRAAEVARAAYDARDEVVPPLSEACVRAILEAVRSDRGETAATFDVA
jgi:hypothetical protein